MEIFKLKLQEYKRKMQDIKRKIKRTYMVSKLKVKAIFAMWFSKIERKLGLEQRCSLCQDRLFCEEYSYRSCKKSPFHVERCYTRHSDK